MTQLTHIATPIHVDWLEEYYDSNTVLKIRFNVGVQEQECNSGQQDDVLNVVPVTPIAKALLLARKAYLQNGGKLLSLEKINKSLGR